MDGHRYSRSWLYVAAAACGVNPSPKRRRWRAGMNDDQVGRGGGARPAAELASGDVERRAPASARARLPAPACRRSVRRADRQPVALRADRRAGGGGGAAISRAGAGAEGHRRRRGAAAEPEGRAGDRPGPVHFRHPRQPAIGAASLSGDAAAEAAIAGAAAEVRKGRPRSSCPALRSSGAARPRS